MFDNTHARSAKRLIIHCGFPKCGSSSIQDFLQELPNENILNNDVSAVRILPIGRAFRFHTEQGTTSLTGLFQSHKMNDVALNVFEKFLRLSFDHYSTLIISAENLSIPINHNQGFDSLKKLVMLSNKIGVDCTLVFYVRRPSLYVVSSYKQWGFRSPDMKDRIGTSLKHVPNGNLTSNTIPQWLFCNTVLKNRSERIQGNPNWAFSIDRIQQSLEGLVFDWVVRPMDKQIMSGGSLIRDFCEHVLGQIVSPKERISNPAFEDFIVHSYHNVPTRLSIHDNRQLIRLSSYRVLESIPRPKLPHMDAVKQHLDDIIDSLILRDNESFSMRFGFESGWSQPSAFRPLSDIKDVIPSLITSQDYTNEYIQYLEWLNICALETCLRDLK